jgi:trk system potassium uptake protein TrkA
MSSKIAVIGLGHFGQSLCVELIDLGAEVLAIDTSAKSVNDISNKVTQAVIADITDELVVEELNLVSYDTVIVALGTDIGTSILAAITLKEAGVKTLWVKSTNALQEKTLLKIGVDKIINPERSAAKRISKQLLSYLFYDFIDLGDGLSLYELNVCNRLVGCKYGSLNMEEDILSMGLKQHDKILPPPLEDYVLKVDDVILLAGPSNTLHQAMQKIAS